MPLSIGIIGLPNVGKSTLFNAITNAQAQASNYPFCTIEPNTGIVSVPDERLSILAKISKSEKIIPATITFIDIAGLVKGASKGEGLGNKFLSNIREVSAIAHVVRCFEDENIIHVHGKLDPLEDIKIIDLELIMADHEMAENILKTQTRKAKSQDKTEKDKLQLITKIKDHLSQNKPVRTLNLSKEEKKLLNGIFFLTAKPSILVANIAENQINQETSITKKISEYAQKSNSGYLSISANIEAELSSLEAKEKAEYLQELGLNESGLNALARESYKILGLQSYLTTGPKETRAWTIKKGTKAPQAAGAIHTDFEKGFIRANIISYQDFIACHGWKNAKDQGLIRQEGKDYIMKEGDIVEFLFNI